MSNICKRIGFFCLVFGFVFIWGAFGYDDYMEMAGMSVDIAITFKHAIEGLGLMAIGVANLTVANYYND